MTSGVKIGSFWHGKSISSLHELCMRSWGKWNEQNYLFATDSLQEAPRGIEVRNATEIVGINEVMNLELVDKNPAGFANIFRVLMLRQIDALWLDTDILVLGDLSKYNGRHVYGMESDTIVNNAVLRFDSDSTLLRDLEVELRKFAGKTILHGDLGPSLLTRVLQSNAAMDESFERSEFYEIHPWEVWKLFAASHRAEIDHRLEGKRIIHLWNESNKKAPFDIHRVMPQVDSFLHRADAELWESKNINPIDEQQLEAWRKSLRKSKSRNEIAGLIPKKLTRGSLSAIGRRVSAGY